MSDDLPTQFIEGINENEEPGTPLTIGDYGCAIRYEPTIKYLLDRVEIYADGQLLDEKREHVFTLYTDHNSLPSNNSLASGKLIIPAEESKSDWFDINLEPKVVVFPNRVYWLATMDHPLTFNFGRAKEGMDVPIVANVTSLAWNDADIRHKFILRFYGKAI